MKPFNDLPGNPFEFSTAERKSHLPVEVAGRGQLKKVVFFSSQTVTERFAGVNTPALRCLSLLA